MGIFMVPYVAGHTDNQCLILDAVGNIYATVTGHLELTRLKDRQWFDAISTSNPEVYEFRNRGILTYFIFEHGESSPNNIWSMVNLERMCILLF